MATYLVVLLSVSLVSPAANAVITRALFQADGDGAIDMLASVQWDQSAADLLADGTQYWGPGHLKGSFETDTDADPTATSVNTVLNDTGFTWNAYIINVYMNKAFTIDAATSPADWSTPVITSVASGLFTDGDGFTWTHKGTISYSSPAAVYDILNGASGTFGATFSWAGSSLYQLELIPVPEPMSLGLLALGGLFLRRRSR